MHERERDRVAPALRGARRRIAALDLAAVRWVARVNSPALDRAMPALSEAANHGKLWVALGACLQATGDRHYRDDPRPYLVASIDLAGLADAWRYDDVERLFPHVYRPIPRAAVVRIVPAPRADDGRFLTFPA